MEAYVYTIKPEPEFQFFLMLFLASIPLFLFCNGIRFKLWFLDIFVLGFCLLILSFPLSIQYDEWKNPPLNEEVTAYLIPGEDTRLYLSGGKHKALYSRTMVYYKVPDGVTAVQRHEGLVYPEVAILYRNLIKQRTK